MVGKKFSTLLAVLLTASILWGCEKTHISESNDSQNNKKVVRIGISQVVEHPALDSTRRGFVEALKSKGFEDGKNIKIDFQSAQGDIPTTQAIAQNFVSQKEDLILAIATPSAQAAYNATKEIPILITAITDPVKAGLVKSFESPGTNVTGTSDAVPINKQLELLKELLPNSKKVGIIYNTGENNSEIQVEGVKQAAPRVGLEITSVGITNVNEIPQALDSLLGNVDVLYMLTDNLVVSSLPFISNKCFEKGLPIIGSEKEHVLAGAIATTGIDYYKLGFQTGLMAIDVLNGKDIKTMPISTQKETQLTINVEAAKKLNISIPEEISSRAEKVSGGVN